jgi:hypothetical protein
MPPARRDVREDERMGPPDSYLRRVQVEINVAEETDHLVWTPEHVPDRDPRKEMPRLFQRRHGRQAFRQAAIFSNGRWIEQDWEIGTNYDYMLQYLWTHMTQILLATSLVIESDDMPEVDSVGHRVIQVRLIHDASTTIYERRAVGGSSRWCLVGREGLIPVPFGRSDYGHGVPDMLTSLSDGIMSSSGFIYINEGTSY